MRLRHPDGQVFEFDAGALCLEFVFTGGEGHRARFEVLRSPADVAAWAAASRLGAAGVAAADVAVSEAEFAALRRLREALWTLTRAATAEASDAGAGVADAVTLLNETARGAGPVPQLVGGRATWRRPVTGGQLAAEIARDAVRTFAEPTVRRLRRCAAPNCALAYVDTSRPGNRRWCSMQRCGNRHKVAGFRQRHGAEEEA
ncbi:MAG TPA: CGNR zinc finger domain-containing protein [Pilimelia sp.]|nr:CGNR zinc finger domain-containing protein [Pilimelia sp.]